MKKLALIVSLVLLGAFVADAGNITATVGNRQDRLRDEFKANWYSLASGGGTLTNGLTVTGEITKDSQYVVVGPDATTALQVDAGTATNGVVDVDFTAAFGAAPYVVCSWSQDGSGVGGADVTNVLYATAVTTTNFAPASGMPFGGAVTNFSWIAVGTE